MTMAMTGGRSGTSSAGSFTLSRVLAVSFLLLSAAPLSSLYAVFFSRHSSSGVYFYPSTVAASNVIAEAVAAVTTKTTTPPTTTTEQRPNPAHDDDEPPPSLTTATATTTAITTTSEAEEEIVQSNNSDADGGADDADENDTPTSTEQQQVPISKSLVETLQNPNATLEEIWTALLQERGNATSDDVWMMVLGAAAASPNGQASSHWHVIIPWALAVLLGIGMPLVASFIEFLRGGDNYLHDSMHHPDSEASLERRKRRKLTRLVLAVKEYRKVLTDEDFVKLDEQQDDNNNYDDDYDDVPRVRLPWPGDEVSSQAASLSTRTVPGSCVVCFNAYQVGKPVIWSSNPKCPHAFCEECILSWLLRQRLRRKEKQCPCCRRPFLVQKSAD